MNVNNVAVFAKECAFIVVFDVDGEWWFYDAWNDFDKGLKQAVEIGGQIIPASMVDGV